MKKDIDYKDIRISRVERKSYQEKEPEPPPPKKKNFFIASVLYVVDKFVAIFFKNFKKEFESINFTKAITSLIECLKDLSKDNCSKDPLFLKKISSAWKNMLEEYDRIYLTKKEKKDEIELLKKEVNQFYSNQEYSLGYYLKRYREENWHPFPFMEILEKLHIEHLEKKEGSHISRWLSLLEEIKLSDKF